MLAESKPVDRWLRPDIWLPTRSKGYYFAEKMKKLENRMDTKRKKSSNNNNNDSYNNMFSIFRMQNSI